MNNLPAIFRTLIVYAICVPLAIWLGYMLTNAWDRTEFISIGALILLLVLPILMRWHHLLLVLCWNMSLMMFFLPGRPSVVMPMILLSFVLSILQRALNRDMRFISVPQITWPMLFIAAVVFCTAKLTGGFGLRSLGSDVMGGKKYAFIFFAIMGYFALTSHRIPPRQAGLYVALFFLPGCLNVIGDLANFLPASFDFIYYVFPANFNPYASAGGQDVGMRYGGVSRLASTIFTFMLARYGLRGIFLSGRLGRPILLLVFLFVSLAGGYRNVLIDAIMLLGALFFLEGLQRTKLLPICILGGILTLMIVIPFADKLPYGFQRTLSFLPYANVSTEAKLDADASTNWRIQIWKAVLPQVPGYLLLGKGYALSQTDFDDMTGNFKVVDASDLGATIAGDYHSGPLSVVIPFGIWGVIGFFWLMAGGGWVLYNNYRYGDPSLKTVNTLLLASFSTGAFFFIVIFGGFSSDMMTFAGTLGLSVSLNGGMCRRLATAPVRMPDQARPPVPSRPGLQPFYPR